MTSHTRTFRKHASTLTRRGAIAMAAAAAMVAGGTLASFPAAAQEMLPPTLCSQANDVAYAIMSKYPISPSMATSFNRFRISKCDLETDFNTLTPVDEQAFGEFRVKLIALKKMASLSGPQLVAK